MHRWFEARKEAAQWPPQGTLARNDADVFLRQQGVRVASPRIVALDRVSEK